MLTCAILDDDPLFTGILESYLSKVGTVTIKGIYHNSLEARSRINFDEIDFLFLDMEMPGMSGIEFLNSLTEVPALVIVSGKTTYGADAFENNAIDYLCKPVSFARFLKSVNKVQTHLEKAKVTDTTASKNIFVKHNGVHIRIPVSDISIVRAQDNDVNIIIGDKTYKVHLKLKDVYDMLPAKEFMQVHRSFIVQLSKIDKVDGEVIEINNRTIPVSRTYISELYDKLKIR